MLPCITVPLPPALTRPPARQDRSLGYTELKVSDLARQIPAPEAGAQFLFESTGKREAEEPLKLERGAFKGRLHYVAEFVPAYAVRGIGFDAGPSEIEQAAQHAEGAVGSDDDGETVHDTDSEDDAAVPEGITVASPVSEHEQPEAEQTHRRATSTDTAVSATSVRTSGTTAVEEKRPEEQGVEMSKEELLKHREYSAC